MPTYYVEDHPERLKQADQSQTEAKVIEAPAKEPAKKAAAKVTTKKG